MTQYVSYHTPPHSVKIVLKEVQHVSFSPALQLFADSNPVSPMFGNRETLVLWMEHNGFSSVDVNFVREGKNTFKVPSIGIINKPGEYLAEPWKIEENWKHLVNVWRRASEYLSYHHGDADEWELDPELVELFRAIEYCDFFMSPDASVDVTE